MGSAKSSIVLLEPQSQPVPTVSVWAEREFFAGCTSWVWKQFLSFSQIAKWSTCVQLWISTKLALPVLGSEQVNLPKFICKFLWHTQCFCAWTQCHQSQVSSQASPQYSEYLISNKYLLTICQELTAESGLVRCCGE